MKKSASAHPGKNPGGSVPESIAFLPELKVCGVSVFDPIWARGFHRDACAELLCLVRGRMTLVFCDRRFSLGPGDFAFVAPNLLHRDMFSPGEEPEIFMAGFSWAATTEFFNAVSHEKISTLADWKRSEILQAILSLRDQAVSDSPLDHALARSRLHSLLLSLWSAVTRRDRSPRIPGGESSDRRHNLMMQTRRYIDAHYHEHVSLERISAHLRVSSYYLSRVFSHESGFSMTRYLTSVRMQRAYEKLRAGAGNVSETAFEVGYESSAYFSRIFKQHFGLAPSKVARRSPPGRK